jgi:deoxyxylulose-5-phosphate synthase
LAKITFKVFQAYRAAKKCSDKPTVILAKTVKGYGMGEAGEGQNTTHSQKKLGLEQVAKFAVPKVRASSGMIGTTLGPSCLSRTNKAIIRLSAMVVDISRSPLDFNKALKVSNSGA